jgi:hypothetical protein
VSLGGAFALGSALALTSELAAPGSASHYVITLAAPQTTATLTFGVSGNQPFTAQFAVTVNSELPANYVAASVAPACNYTVTGPTAPLASASGTFGVDVNTAAGCSWTASSSDSFISVTNGSGTGTGVARFSISQNTGSTLRTG